MSNKSESDRSVKTVKDFLKIGSKLKVNITAQENNGLFWLRAEESYDTFINMQEELAKSCENYDTTSGEVGEIYGVQYKGIWYRMVFIKKTFKYILRCIDTGQIVFLDKCVFKDLPSKLKLTEQLAFRVEFEDPVPEVKKYPSKIITIDIKGRNSNKFHTVKVCVQNEEGLSGEVAVPAVSERRKHKISEVSQRKQKHLRRCSIDELGVGKSGIFSLSEIESDTFYGYVPVIDGNKVVSGLEDFVSACHTDDEINAKVGYVVFVKENKSQTPLRGLVVSKTTSDYIVKLLDAGGFKRSQQVFKIPQNKIDMVDIGCKMTLKEKYDESFKFQPRTSYHFDVIDKLPGEKWLCVFKNKQQETVNGILERVEDQLPEELMYFPMESGCTVVISAFLSKTNSVFVQEAGIGKSHLKQLIRKVNDWVPLFEGKISNIEVGDIVSAKYTEDNNWYRVKVLSKIKTNVTVLFVDFGNQQKMDVSELIPLPDDLKSEPFFAREVTFVNGKHSFSTEGERYLRNILECQNMIMTYEGRISNGVVLREERTGVELNKILFCEATKNGNDESVPMSENFTKMFLQPQTFSESSVESVHILYVGEQFSEEGIFWAADPTSDDFIYVMNELGPKISSHCNSHLEDYTPRVGELCFAVFQGDWYRGHIVGEDEGGFAVFFVDYGNTDVVKQQDICKMDVKYFKTPMTAIKCCIYGFEVMDKEQINAVYHYLLNNVNKIVNSVRVEKMDDHYTVKIFGVFNMKSNKEK